LNKKKYVKISLSDTFPLKNRCKYCSSIPAWYYHTRISSSFQDHEIAQFINMWLTGSHKRMCQDFYLTEMPKSFTNTNNFAHAVDYKGFNPRFHKNSKYHNYDHSGTVVDHLSCSCGKTNWAFNETRAKNKPEIKQRKARITCPNKYVY
jgi:hypothetical protein